MALCIEVGCELEMDRNRVCVLHALKERVEGLVKDIDEAIDAVNRVVGEAQAASEEAAEQAKKDGEEALARQHFEMNQQIERLEAQLARAREDRRG